MSIKNSRLIYEHNINDPLCGKSFKFAVINKKFYIEKFDILNRPYWMNLDKINKDYRIDYKTSIAWYLYANYKDISITDEIWKLKPDINREYPWQIMGLWLHFDILRDQLYDKTELIFPNKTKDSLLLLKDSIEKLLQKELENDELIQYKIILQEVDKRLEF